MSLIPPASPQQIRSTPLAQSVGPNVVVKQLREVFRDAFDQLGGAGWLVDFVQQDPANARVFIGAISKLLPAPTQSVIVKGDAENPLHVVAGSLKGLSDSELQQMQGLIAKAAAATVAGTIDAQ
jgi:hypothetical protein